MCANPQIPAVANAIFDAVGVRIDMLPITPERVLRALMELPAREGLLLEEVHAEGDVAVEACRWIEL